jgi:hypothetical protein
MGIAIIPGMNMNQIGLLLQLIGLFFVSVFAGILLEREMVGKFVDKGVKKLNEISAGLAKMFPWPSDVWKEHSKAGWGRMRFWLIEALLTISFTLMLDLRGLQFWWLGILTIFMEPLLIALDFRDHSLKRFLERALLVVVVIPFFSLAIGMAVSRAALRWLARVDTMKRGLILLGTLSILIGSILEYIASF